MTNPGNYFQKSGEHSACFPETISSIFPNFWKSGEKTAFFLETISTQISWGSSQKFFISIFRVSTRRVFRKHFPVKLHGSPVRKQILNGKSLRKTRCTLSIQISSQFLFSLSFIGQMRSRVWTEIWSPPYSHLSRKNIKFEKSHGIR